MMMVSEELEYKCIHEKRLNKNENRITELEARANFKEQKIEDLSVNIHDMNEKLDNIAKSVNDLKLQSIKDDNAIVQQLADNKREIAELKSSQDTLWKALTLGLSALSILFVILSFLITIIH